MVKNSGKIDIKFNYDDFKIEFDKYITSNRIDLSKLKSIGLNEMPISNKAQEIKVPGYVSNSNYVTLDQDINGTKSFKVMFGKPAKDMANFKKGDRVLVTLVGTNVYSIEKHEISEKLDAMISGVSENTKNTTFQTKPKSQKPKVKLSDRGFYVDRKHQRILDALTNANSKNVNAAIGVYGAAGYGKTSLAEHFAYMNKLPLLEIDCTTIDDNLAWFGTPTLRDGSASFDLSQFSEFLMKGNCVITFDELNRAPVWVTNSLLSILDHRAETIVKNIKIKVGKGISFFATQNVGWDYAGTNPIDKALRRRLKGIIKVDALPPDVENVVMMYHHSIDNDVCTKIINVMNKLRKSLVDYSINVSTATSIDIAFWIDNGLSPRESFELVIINDAPEDAKKIVLDAINLEGL